MSHNEQNEVETSKHTEDSYRNEVSRLLEGHKTRFSKRLDKAHDKDFTIVDEIARWNRILIDEDAKPLINYDIYRKRKYWNLATGIRLGRRTFSSKSAEVEAYLKYLDWLKELPSKQIQPSQEQPSLTLNQIAPNELSPNELILRQEELFFKADSLKLERKKLNAERLAISETTEQPKPAKATSTAEQSNEGGTGVESEQKLTLWQAAYLLAYKREMLYESRHPNYEVSQNFAKEHCRLTSHHSGNLLYDKWKLLRQEREKFFYSALDAEKAGDKWHDKRPKSFLEDMKKIIPLLTGEQKAEAKTDLSNWNTMYLREVE